MRISVVIATYNGEKYIEQQLDSILNQTVLPYEIIICDDCSKDNTVEIAKNRLNSSGIKNKIFSNIINSGVTKTFENAVVNSEGEIIMFCDQDDYWCSDKIEKTIDAFVTYNPELVFTDANIVDDTLNIVKGKLWESVSFNPSSDDLFIIYNQYELLIEMIKHNIVTGMTMACTRDLIEKTLPFPIYPLHDYWIALIANCVGKIVGINRSLTLYRQHSNNVVGTSRKYSLKNKKVLRTHYLNAFKHQVEFAEIIIRLAKEYELPNNYISFINGYNNFMVDRHDFVINKHSIFKVLKNKKQYKRFFIKQERTLYKDLLYIVFLR